MKRLYIYQQSFDVSKLSTLSFATEKDVTTFFKITRSDIARMTCSKSNSMTRRNRLIARRFTQSIIRLYKNVTVLVDFLGGLDRFYPDVLVLSQELCEELESKGIRKYACAERKRLLDYCEKFNLKHIECSDPDITKSDIFSDVVDSILHFKERQNLTNVN